jgi:hypothetical protein
MGLLSNILARFSAPEKGAATALTPPEQPKVKPGSQTVPSNLRRSSTRSTQKLQETDRRVATSDLLTLRAGTSTKKTIRDLATVTPDLSASVNAYIRLAVTPKFTAIARNLEGVADPVATAAVQQLLTRFNHLQDYAQGYSEIRNIHGVAEAMVKELRIEGACALELVLDKARLPYKLQPISVSQIVWEDDGKQVYPVQKTAGGEEIALDIPTFFYEEIDSDLTSAYSVSPMEAAVQPTLQHQEFTNDIRRVIKRALHPRLTAEIDMDVFRKSIPLDVAGDPEKLAAYQSQFLTTVQEQVNNLEPDDALVHYSLMKFEYLSRGNESLEREYATLQAIVNSKMAAGSKVPAAVLGHGAGSQNIASTESSLFLKYSTGTQLHVNSIISRALTMGARLLGHDCYVEFAFEQPDLRPDAELEAFKAMRQSRVLEQLSLGLISDEEASILLTGNLPPAGMKPLSGTGFKGGSTAINANPYSSTGSQGTTQSASDKANAPETPTQPKGPAQKQGQ